VIGEAEPQSSIVQRAIAGGGAIGRARRATIVAVALIAVLAIVVLGRPSEVVVAPQPTPSPGASTTGLIPADLLHSWQRPYAVTPDLDQWETGFLFVASETLDYGPEPGTPASRSDVAVVTGGLNALEVTATFETQGCAFGAVGTYRWSLEGQGTVMTLRAIGPDACPARQEALAGQWVRSDLPPAGQSEPMLPPGTYLTLGFDPFGVPEVSGQLSYTLPPGWNVLEDQPASFTAHHVLDNTFVLLLAEPRMAAEIESGTTCGPFSEAPGVAHGVDDIVAAIIARPGVGSTLPAPVTVGGYEGQILDLNVARSWTGGCQAPEGLIVGIPLLLGAGSGTGPTIGIGRDSAIRLILLDLTNGRTLSIAIFKPDASSASPFEEQVAVAMPVIESFEFRAPAP